LSNFLFETSGNNLLISATDLDLSVRTFCAAKVKNPGCCTVPGRKLYDYVRLLADGEVAIKSQENDWVQVRCGRSNTRFVGLPRKNFPSLPLYPAQAAVRLPAAVFRASISRTIFAMSHEESRYTWNGALLIVQPTTITMVATDGSRLAHVQTLVMLRLGGQGRHFKHKRDLARELKRWETEYNELRPHLALNGKTPGERLRNLTRSSETAKDRS
jgi:DNA polymerase-3 subunit beta